MKSWSTSLFSYLNQYEDISGCMVKEPNYFCDDLDFETFKLRYPDDIYINTSTYDDIAEWMKKINTDDRHCAHIKDSTEYEKIFPETTAKYRMEASTNYLFSKNAAKNIYWFDSQAKIIILLRDPVQRLYSHYFMNLKHWYVKWSVLDTIQYDLSIKERNFWNAEMYVEYWMYVEQVKRFLKYFSENQICIIFNHELKNELNLTLEKVCNFLKIDFKQIDHIHQNVWRIQKKSLLNTLIKFLPHGFVNKHIPVWLRNLFVNLLYSNKPKLSEIERKEIYWFYHDEILELEDLLHKDLSLWKI